MTLSRDVARDRFARFVRRVLQDARARGMNDGAIHQATGITPTTFHRWQRGDWERFPRVEKVVAFCVGLDVPAEAALAALGIRDGNQAPPPEPPLDPDLRRIARILNDPNVSDADKAYVRRTLQVLASIGTRRPEPAK